MSKTFASNAANRLRKNADCCAVDFDLAAGPAVGVGVGMVAKPVSTVFDKMKGSTSSSVAVHSDWARNLAEAYPDLFHLTCSKAIARLPQCGPGWSAIVERMCARIDAALTERERFRFERVAERNGALRVYWGGKLSANSEAVIRGAIDLAEARSLCFCEHCGLEGRLHRDGEVVVTRCDRHAPGVPVTAHSDFKNLHLTQKMTAGRQWVVVIRRYDPQSDAFIDVDPADAEER